MKLFDFMATPPLCLSSPAVPHATSCAIASNFCASKEGALTHSLWSRRGWQNGSPRRESGR
jgi:hypothetical protein